ncbi:hypothetical protein DFQ27_001342 [Actinomortierella ambigua]|uniref:Uncharacterized protein n=1 Tax=Actinomortierella ambigua TaxID=1343610 RepID=A0A9P6QCQ6_9FUNG|nr:hypothetical protein DFQ27_001342 [Actinomortierella ambigua]
MEQQAKIAIARGRPSNEPYQRYSWTLERLVRIYKVDASPSRVVLLDYMKATIPSHVLDTMTLLYVMDVRSNLVKVADPSKSLAIDSAHLFITYLEKMHGPDDCEDRKRLLATLDELGAKDRPPKRLTKAASPTDASANPADPTTLRINRSYLRFKEGDQPVGFLTKPQRRVTNKESESYLANNIYRLLGNLVDVEDAIAQFEAEIRSRKQNALAAGIPFPEPPNWDFCASAFIKVTLSDAVRRDQVVRLVHDGRRANETWVEFARRLRTEMRLYSMNDSEADYFVPALQEKVTEVINNMLTNFGLSAGHRVRHFAAFNDFVEELSAMHGPANVKKRSADGDSPRPAKSRSLARSGATMSTQLSSSPPTVHSKSTA